MGRNLRNLIRMTSEEVDTFLHGRRTMSVATIGPGGRIHLVAVWYGFLDGAVAFHTKAKSQKVQNLRRDPRMTCLVEEGRRYDELRGVELVGTAELIDDPDRLWAVGVSAFERYQGRYTDEVRPLLEATLQKRVAVRLRVERVVSWDHARLASAAGSPQ